MCLQLVPTALDEVVKYVSVLWFCSQALSLTGWARHPGLEKVLSVISEISSEVSDHFKRTLVKKPDLCNEQAR